jgi:alpha-beta hydrolase superfamily lysophospholipase/SAM-dependent methyltransferase
MTVEAVVEAPKGEAAAGRPCEEATFATWDGTELFYRAWLPADSAPRQALVLLHRGHEHSGRFQQFVDELGLEDVAIFAWDARGHGRSPGDRGYAPDFAAIVRDLDCFTRFLCGRYGVALRDMVVLGHSVGAVAVAAWVHDYAPPVRGMVLLTPALRVKLYVPLALPALRLRMAFGGRSFIKSYVRANVLTHDPWQAWQYEQDPLISRSIATNLLIDLHDTSTRLLRDAAAIHAPTLLLASGADWVVKHRALRRFFRRLSSSVKEMHTLDGFYHAILHEKQRDEPIGMIGRFVRNCFEQPAEPPSLLNADREGYTWREYQRLRRPLRPWSMKGLSYRLQRAFLKTVGSLSEGIWLGWRKGFNSGESLDYVYRNRAQGLALLGALIDRIYLNAIGWRGIRVRKRHLQEALRETIDALRAAGEPVRIVDVAAGPGRYLLEALERYRDDADVSAMLRDRSEPALRAGRGLAMDFGVTRATTFAPGDAFDPDELARIEPRPNVAVVSGLYELFPENAKVRDSLRGLWQALRPGGYLIYTNQPWHPQLKMIARVLVGPDGQPWVMRRRTQAEMDQLVEAEGFKKIGMRIDPHGIFTVSVARKQDAKG